MSRKLASIRKIDAILPIEKADNIEAAVIGGWNVIVKKGQYKPNDLCVYFEIDSFLPESLAPFLNSSSGPKEYEGVKGNRLKTKKLRGCLSQGLILSLIECGLSHEEDGNIYPDGDVEEGADITDFLHVLKWERPQPQINPYSRSGSSVGRFPSFIPKTDQERCQNYGPQLKQWAEQGLVFEVTEKLDGTSCTIYYKNRDKLPWWKVFWNRLLFRKAPTNYGVCSRNIGLKEDPPTLYWTVAKQDGLLNNFISYCENNNLELALQGEIIGDGVSGAVPNYYQLTDKQFYLFDVFDIREQKYYTSDMRLKLVSDLGIEHVPVLGEQVAVEDIQYYLQMADGESQINKRLREGLVFKSLDHPHISFKAVSNKWLLKNDGE